MTEETAARRIECLRQDLSARGVDGLLVTNVLNIRWLTGFSGSYAIAFVGKDTAWLAVDSRYTLQAHEQCRGVDFRDLTSSGGENVAALLRDTVARRVGFESEHLTVATLESYKASLADSVELVPLKDVVRTLRHRKDEQEIACLRRACGIADAVFAHVVELIRPGVSERDLALEIEWQIRKTHGAEVSFPSIVVSGPRSALPHGAPTDRVVEVGDFVTMDFGARWEGYCSDITRTVVVGRASEEQKAVYTTVLEAQRRAMERMSPGVAARDVDAEARQWIAQSGHAEHFGHGLGHGVGLEVHDGPNMSPRSDFQLEPGMVLTVEPGIYVPNWGGVRIEDDVLITADGHEVLTAADRSLIEL